LIGFQRFWQGAYCYDVLDGPEGNDAAMRPNQIFAISLPLAGGEAGDRSAKGQGLTDKLDEMLAEAQLDSEKMGRLATSIESFAEAAENIEPAANSVAATNKYSEQLSLAATQMESLNSLYKVQYDSAERQAQMSDAVAENTERLKEQMESLATNLSSLNGVYGGMLSAMSNRA
jgi:gliding motility-associated protein GldL